MLVKYFLKSFNDFIKTVIYSNTNINIHVIFKHKNKYCLYYGNSNEILIFHDKENKASGPGLFQLGEKNLIKLPDSFLHFSPGNIYIYVCEVERIIFDDNKRGASRN